jgi:hypothetical protein
MEYVEGKDLGKIIQTEKQIAVPRALKLFRQVLLAVDEAHKKGIVHRDLKSDNIMVCLGPDGKEITKIMDFGIAKIVEGEETPSATGLNQNQQFKTRKGVVTGTPQYMSPEQASGDPNIDGRSDIYSLGIILYEIVLGDLPFKSNTAMGYLGKHIVEPPIPVKEARPDIALPKDLERAIMKCLEKAREDRYQTAGEMLADMETDLWLEVFGQVGSSSGKLPGNTAQRAAAGGGGGGKGGGGKKVVVLLIVLAALAAGGWYGFQWWRAQQAARRVGYLRDAGEAIAAGDVDRARALLDEAGGDDEAARALRGSIDRIEEAKKQAGAGEKRASDAPSAPSGTAETAPAAPTAPSSSADPAPGAPTGTAGGE